MAEAVDGKDFFVEAFDTALKDILKSLPGRFKFLSITNYQRKALVSFLSGKDTFVCLPTGSGKSLIFQLAV